MADTARKLKLRMVLSYGGTPILSNLVAIALINLWMGYLLFEPEARQFFIERVLTTGWMNFLINWSAFIPAFAFIGWYLYPVGKLFDKRPEDYDEKALRHLVNAPFYLSIIGLVGWVYAGFMLSLVYELADFKQTWQIFVSNTVINLTLGTVTFVISFYLLDLSNRRWFIPHFLPDGDFSRIPNARRYPLAFRLTIFMFGTALAPVAILGLAAIRLSEKVGSGSDAPVRIVLLIALMIVLGLYLSILLARTLRTPLRELQRAAAQIRGGDYAVRLPVTTNDEVGRLTQGINEMAAGLREREHIRETFGRAVDPSVRDYLLRSPHGMKGELRDVTVLFSDIRGFTAFSETQTPEALVAWLNRYLAVMTECVSRHGGVVNKYIGDAIMAVFNAPLPVENHANRAVACALDMLATLARLNAELVTEEIPEVRIGIGLHCGPVTAGSVGSADRLEYTVIGDTVNTASRIEGLCKKAGRPLLLSRAVAEACGNEWEFVRLGKAHVKGKADALEILTVNI
ncbi:MAG: adenylate/guanylate cyclase domain-containing protein [Spirochaetota bacterium]